MAHAGADALAQPGQEPAGRDHPARLLGRAQRAGGARGRLPAHKRLAHAGRMSAHADRARSDGAGPAAAPRPSYRLPSPAPAQVFGFSFNQLMGPVPATVAFNASFEVLGLGISGNNLSGGCPLPSRRPGACHQLPAVSRGRRVRRLWVGSRRAVIMQAPAHAGCPPGCHPHRPFACVASLSPVRH